MTVTCEASVLGSMMKRMTLTKPKEALTISLVRDDSSRQTLYSSCSNVDTSIESERTNKNGVLNPAHYLDITCSQKGVPLYSNTMRVRAKMVQVIMVTEPVSPAYIRTKNCSMASASQAGKVIYSNVCQTLKMRTLFLYIWNRCITFCVPTETSKNFSYFHEQGVSIFTSNNRNLFGTNNHLKAREREKSS